MSEAVPPNQFGLTVRMRKAFADSGDKTLLNDVDADIERRQWEKINELQEKIRLLKENDDERLTETWVEEHMLLAMAPLKVEMGWEKWIARGAAAGVGSIFTAVIIYFIEHHHL